MYLELEPDSPVPIFQQIHDAIVEGILKGQIRPGQHLPPVRRVAVEFGVNPATVKKAYDQLQQDGLARTEPRSGTVVTQPGAPSAKQKQQLRDALRSTVTRALAQGFSADNVHRVLDELFASLPNPENTPTRSRKA